MICGNVYRNAVFFVGVLCSANAYGLPTNADFSSGLAGWTASGSVSDGGGFAVFAEAGTPASSSLYQDFVLDPGATTLSFDYLFVTDGTFNHLALPDAFTARLLNPATLVPLLATPLRDDYVYHDARGESDSLALDAGLVTRTPVTDPTRPDWYTVSLDVSSLPSHIAVRLMFDLFGGDNNQTTFAAVDNIGVAGTGPAVIPEPLTATLVASALVAAGCAARLRKGGVAGGGSPEKG